MQHISPFWPAKRNTRHGLLNRLTIRFLCISTLFLLALMPRIGWAQTQTPVTASTFSTLKSYLESTTNYTITLDSDVTWDDTFDITVRGTKTLRSSSGNKTISRKAGNQVSSIVLMDGASLTVDHIIFDGKEVPNCASMILVERDDTDSLYAAASLTMTNCTIKDCILNYGMDLPTPPSTPGNYHYIRSFSGAAINFSPSNRTGTNTSNLRNIQLTNCVFDNNRVTMLSGTPLVENISGINALTKLYCNGGAIGIGDAIGAGSHITSCTFTNNKAAQGGGALYFENTLNEVQVIGCTIGTQNNPNTAGTKDSNGYCVIPAKGGRGGGIYFAGGKVKFKNTKIEHNLAYYYGGGIYIQKSQSIKFIEGTNNNSISNNKVAESITPDDGQAFGGGIYVGDDNGIAGVDIQYTNIYSNKAWRGGGIFINGENHQPAPVFSNCNIGSEDKGNEATRYGGGIYLFGSQAKFYNCKIQYNYTAETTGDYIGTGGGIYKSSNTTAEDQQLFQGCDISYNGCQGSTTKTRWGGGVYIESNNHGSANYQPRTTFYQCDIHHNKASEEGGGLYLNYEGIKLQQNKVYSNESKKGGGIYMLDGKILGGSGANKIYRNTASIDGGGIYYENGTIQGNNYVYVNTATKNGGGLYVNTKGSTATNRTFDHLFVGTDDASAIDMGNRAENGGGIYIKNEQTDITITLDACSIVHNKVRSDSTTTINQGGGVYMSDASGTKAYTVKLAGGTNIQGNEALGGGGVYINQDVHTLTLNLTNATLSGNKATTGDGGGIYNNKGTVLCESGCSFTFDGNKALAGSGGGIYNNSGTVECNNGSFTFDGNEALVGGGGGIYNNSGTLTLNGTDGMRVFKNNKAFRVGNSGGGGGGIYNNGTATLTNCDIGNNNEAENGGGINNTGSLTLNNTRVSYNTATNNGGGIFHNSSTALTLQGNTTFSGNEAQNNGGGLFNGNNTTSTITSATFNGNKAITNNGGGIYNSGTTTITSATFDGNTAGNDGGGIYNGYKKTTTITTSATFNGNIANNNGGGINNQGTVNGNNSTVSFVGNQAPTGNGGGIYNLNILDLDGTNTKTFTGNTAKNGGGIYNDSIKYNEPIVVPPPPITLKKQIKAPGATNWNNATLTDADFKGRVRLYYGYRYTNSTTTMDSLVLFYDYNFGTGEGGDLGINAYRKKSNSNVATYIYLYAAYTPTQDESGYGTEYRLYVSTDRFDSDNGLTLSVSSTGYGMTIRNPSPSTTYSNWPNGYSGMTDSYGGRGDALNTSLPTSLNLAGTANLENCLMGGSAANANKATDGHGGAIYIDDASTANLENSSITNNEAARFGGGVYICTNGIMGVEGAVRVSGNTTQRVPGTGTGQYPYLKANKEDDVCLQTIDTESKETQNTSGKIKVLGDMSNSYIGITEEQIATGVDNNPSANILRARNDRGDNIRQFTINFGGDGASWSGHDQDAARVYFFSNDTKLGVKPLPHNGINIITTTGRLEVTLGQRPSTKWYVAGIVDDGDKLWGFDTNDGDRGLYPDLPLRTLTGPNGVFARGYDPEIDTIYVVRAVSMAAEQAAWSTLPVSDAVIIRYPIGAIYSTDQNHNEFFSGAAYNIAESVGSKEVTLFRYPGGHDLSCTMEISGHGPITVDGETGENPQPHTNWGSGEPYDPTNPSATPNESLAPGPNLGPVVAMDNTAKPAKLYQIEMNGLSDYDGDDEDGDHNPQEYPISPESALLSVESGTQTITLKEGCEILLNNNKKGTLDLDKKEIRPGGGVFNNGTLVCDSVLIEQNQTAKSGAGMYINNGTATLQNDSEIKDNAANENGGGVYINNSGTMQVNGTGTNGVKIQHNTAKTHGGGVYKLGTLKVQGLVTITENEQATAVTENVYIPVESANDQTILITDELACGSRIGVTKTKKWKGGTPAYGINGDHNYDNDDHLDSVRTVIAKVSSNATKTWALDAYKRNVFFDDKGFYSVWSFNYHKTNVANDYSNQNDYFIETWRSFADPSGFASNRVSTPAGLAQFAKIVNTTGSTPPTDVIQITDIDLAGHYWEPIGFSTGSTCDPITDYQFSGNYDGQGHLIRNAISILPTQTMGLFGKLNGGSIVRTFNINADFTGTFDGDGGTHIGGIAGQVEGDNPLIDRCEAQGKMENYTGTTSNTGGIAGHVASGEVRNSFAVASTLSGTTVGGLVGSNAGTVKNAYAVNNTLPGSGTVGALVGNNTGTLSNAYTDASSGNVVGSGSGTNVYSAGATGATAYTPTIGADHLGYMCIDNGVGFNTLTDSQKEGLVEGKDYFTFKDAGGSEVTLIPLFRLLSLNAKALNNSDKYTTYDEWARPALAFYGDLNEEGTSGTINRPINGDLPLLMMDNYDASNNIGAGGFRAVSNYSGSVDVLQYSGPIRDYSSYNNNPAYNNSPIDGMMTRSTGSDSHFIYGDVENGSTVDNFSADRVSIYEHAAITQAGTLAGFNNTYVGVTFDNSGNGNALSTDGMNQLGAQKLPRDWHMLSTPVNNAPLGFRYGDSDSHNKPINGHTDYADNHDAEGFFNNPWGNASGTHTPNNPSATEFSWLNDGGTGHNRYWMHGWDNSRAAGTHSNSTTYPAITWQDGYFPSKVNTSAIQFGEQLFIVADGSNGSNEYLGEGKHRYPYGMDFYSWYEPKYHYINFKRNGPNHWHSDEPHKHLDYTPETASNITFDENVNETTLLNGKGYMASIHIPTFLQTNGALGGSTPGGGGDGPTVYRVGVANWGLVSLGMPGKKNDDTVKDVPRINVNGYYQNSVFDELDEQQSKGFLDITYLHNLKSGSDNLSGLYLIDKNDDPFSKGTTINQVTISMDDNFWSDYNHEYAYDFFYDPTNLPQGITFGEPESGPVANFIMSFYTDSFVPGQDLLEESSYSVTSGDKNITLYKIKGSGGQGVTVTHTTDDDEEITGCLYAGMIQGWNCHGWEELEEYESLDRYTSYPLHLFVVDDQTSESKSEAESRAYTPYEKSIAITNTDNTLDLCEGWNLVGNPFHAYLDFNKLCEANEGVISDDTYVVYNADGFGKEVDEEGEISGQFGDGFSYYVKNSSSNGAYAHRYLHPHQGFFVNVSAPQGEKAATSETLTFSEEHTVLRSQIGTSGSYRGEERPAYPLVNLFLTSAKGCADVCVVELNRPEWGGGTKLREMYTGNGLFYAFHDNKNYAALFATPDAERIPLKFEAKDAAGDTYTLSWNTQNGDFSKLLLVDNLTGVQYDMLRNSSYSFSGKKGDYYSRFYITFDVTGIDEEQDDDDDTTGSASTTFAFFDGSQWVVTNDGHGPVQLDLIDLQGRVLHSTAIGEGQTHVSLPQVATGMYLLRMTSQNGMKVQKIIVR